MNTTPETMVMAWTVIKIVIDMLSEILPSWTKPFVAVGLWLAWALSFVEGSLDMAIFLWITTWASSIGIHEMTKVGTAIKTSIKKRNALSPQD